MNALPIALSVFAAILFAGLYLRHQHRSSADRDAVRESLPDAVVSSPPEGDLRRTLSPREQRLADLRERDKTGLCRYCDAPAKRQVPTAPPVAHVLDPILRRFNVLVMLRYRLELEAPLDQGVPEVLCDAHRESARGHIDRRIADDMAELAEFAEKRRARMLEFTMYELDEKMRADADAMRQKKTPKRTSVVERPVTQLRAVNGSGG
jgi:hypothetical protein